MAAKKSQTVSRPKSSAALDFVKKAELQRMRQEKAPLDIARPVAVMNVNSSDSEVDKITQESVEQEKNKSKKSRSKIVEQSRKLPEVYEPFSTRVRRDLKLKLKRISHQREEQGHSEFNIQALVEEALVQWLDRQPISVRRS